MQLFLEIDLIEIDALNQRNFVWLGEQKQKVTQILLYVMLYLHQYCQCGTTFQLMKIIVFKLFDI